MYTTQDPLESRPKQPFQPHLLFSYTSFLWSLMTPWPCVYFECFCPLSFLKNQFQGYLPLTVLSESNQSLITTSRLLVFLILVYRRPFRSVFLISCLILDLWSNHYILPYLTSQKRVFANQVAVALYNIWFQLFLFIWTEKNTLSITLCFSWDSSSPNWLLLLPNSL